MFWVRFRRVSGFRISDVRSSDADIWRFRFRKDILFSRFFVFSMSWLRVAIRAGRVRASVACWVRSSFRRVWFR